jgi:tetratricopeptide (TPR) repeat protein
VLDHIIVESEGPGSEAWLDATMLKADTYTVENVDYERALEIAEPTSDTLTQQADPNMRVQMRWFLGALMRQNDRTTEALSMLSGILDENPAIVGPNRHLQALQAMAQIYEQRDGLGEAIGVFNRYLDAHPEVEFKPELLMIKGDILKILERPEEAAEAYDQAEADLSEKIDNALGAEEKSGLIVRLAAILENQEKYEEARELYRSILDDYPMLDLASRAETMWRLADNYLADEEIESALALFDQIQKDFPQTPYQTRAYVRSQQIKTMQMQSEPSTNTLMQVDRPTTGTIEAIDQITTGTITPTPAPQSDDRPSAGTDRKQD